MTHAFETGIVWFRRDLRLGDNPALHAAVSSCRQLIPLYIDDDSEDDWAPGAASRWWLHHSLAALQASVGDIGGQLILRRGEPLQVLRDVIEASGAEALFWNRLYEPAAIKRDKAIKQALSESEIAVHSYNGALLIEPWEVETKAGTPYRVFTPYWREAKKRLSLDKPFGAPGKLSSPAKLPDSMALEALDLLPSINWDAGLAAAWQPGEAAARDRAETWSAGPVRDYDEQRDLPAVDGVSRLSPHLHFGELSARELYTRIRERHDKDDKGSEVYLSELGWREFSHHILFHYPHTSDKPMNEKFEDFPWRDDVDGEIRAWQRGRTGIPIVDAGMRQLWQTGWMHNRVRMIVASFLVKNIRAHWLNGARWFWDTLVDADLPANSMGWQWSAGTGADAAPYFRIFNPQRQGERFDKSGDYVRRYVPELKALPDKYIHQPWALPESKARQLGFEPGIDYPEPIVDLGASREAALDAFKSLKDETE